MRSKQIYAFVALILTLSVTRANASSLEDCTQADDKSVASSGCSDLIFDADRSREVRSWAYSRRAGISDDVDQAMSDLDQSIYLDPNNAYAFALRGHLRANKHDDQRAMEDFNQALRLRPNDAHTLNNRGNIWENQGAHDKAIADYTAAIKVDPKIREAYLGRAKVRTRQRDFDRARADYDAVLNMHPHDAIVLANRGDMFEAKGDLAAALADFNEAIEANPQLADAYNGRANVWWRRGEPSRALADMDRAIAINPNNSIFYITRATALFEMEQSRAALAAYDQAIRLNPNEAIAFNNRGFIRRTLGDLKGAIADFDQSIKLDPTYAKAWANRGEAWGLLGNLDQALADQNQAVKLNPTDAFGYFARGNTLRYKGQFRAAVAEYDQALKVGQYDLAALVGKGLTYEKMGDFAAARGEFLKAVESTVQFRSDVNRQALETARARLAALDSGAAQPIIPPVPAKAASLTSLPTPKISIPTSVAAQPSAGRRVALVIGNANYWNANALNNPVQDALAVSRAFRALGFSVVTLGSDVTRSQMTDLLKEFAIQAGDSDWAVVYYSGHGVERNGVNYLIPVDAKIDEDSDFEATAIPLDDIMSAVDRAKKLKLIMLDACRDNPFAATNRLMVTPSSQASNMFASSDTSGGIPAQPGLSEVKVSSGMLVVYAAKHGQLALDGDGDDSPFAVALLQRIATPNVEINKLFRLVRDDVMEATGGRQEPYTYGSLPGKEDFYFVTK